jgi:arsenate reductase
LLQRDRCPIIPAWCRFYWPFDDPAAVAGTDSEKLAKFREVRDQIVQRMRD